MGSLLNGNAYTRAMGKYYAETSTFRSFMMWCRVRLVLCIHICPHFDQELYDVELLGVSVPCSMGCLFYYQGCLHWRHGHVEIVRHRGFDLLRLDDIT